MKTLKLISILLCLTVSHQAGAEVAARNLTKIDSYQTQIVKLNGEKKKLEELYEETETRLFELKNRLEFITDYVLDNELEVNVTDADAIQFEIDLILAEHPLAANSAIAVTAAALSKFYNSRVVTILAKEGEAGLIARIMKRYPRLSKNAAYAVAAAVIVYAGCETYNNTKYLSYLRSLDNAQLQTLIETTSEEIRAERNLLADIIKQIINVEAKLNQFSTERLQKNYNFIK